LLSNLPLGLALVDRDGRFLFANEAFARVAGFEPQSLPPYPGDLVVAEDKAAVSDTIRRYARGQSMSGDIAVRLKNDPDEAVARGAAIYAGYLLARQNDVGTPPPTFKVTDVNSHSLGIQGIEQTTGLKENVIVIPRNTSLPAVATQRFATHSSAGGQSVTVSQR